MSSELDNQAGDKELPCDAEYHAEIDAVLADSGEMPLDAVEPMPEIETSDVLFGFVSPLCDIVCPSWSITVPEKKALCDSYGMLIDKYFPDGGFDRFGAEIAAIGITVTIFQSRLGTPRKPVKEKKEKKPQVAANDEFSGVSVDAS